MALDPNAAAAPGSGVFGLFDRPKDSRIVLLPVPFEATTSYGGGTAGGPEAILAASRQVELFDLETGKPYEAGIAWLPVPGEVDAWNREGIERARPVVAAGGVDPEREELVVAAARVDALCEKTEQRGPDRGDAVDQVGRDGGHRRRRSFHRLRGDCRGRRGEPAHGHPAPRRACGSSPGLRGICLVARFNHGERDEAPSQGG